MSAPHPFATPDRLRRLQIEVTTGCNLRCAGCQRTLGMQDGTWRNAHMPLARFEAVLRNAPPAEVIILQGIGEPTLHPAIADMIRAARAAGKFGVVSFNTNALLRDPAEYAALRDAGLGHVSVSVDSLDPVTAEALRSGTDVARLAAAIPALLRLFDGALTVSIVLGRRNLAELPAMVGRLHDMGVRTIEVQPLISYAAASEPLALDAAGHATARAVLAALRARHPDLNLLAAAALTPNGTRCRRPFHAAYVTVDGFLTPCCVTNDASLFGRASLAETPFAAVWGSPSVGAFLSSYLDRSPAICQGCAFNPAGPEVTAPRARLDAANTDLRAGRVEAATAAFRAVLEEPTTAEALHGLGLSRLQAGDTQAALPLLRAAVALDPSPQYTHNLARAADRAGLAGEAAELERAVLAASPEYLPAWLGLSASLAAQGKRTEAAGVLLDLISRAVGGGNESAITHAAATAATLDPGHKALLATANRLRVAGQVGPARTLLAARLAQAPADLAAGLALAMTELAVIHMTEAEATQRRAAYSAALARLYAGVATADAGALAAGAGEVGNAKPFFLSYQGEDDTALMRRYGAIVGRLMDTAPSPSPEPSPPPARRRPARLRVGFVTAYFHLHSVSKLFGGWIRHLDRDRFEVLGYHLGAAQDAVSNDLARHCAAFRHGLPDEAAWMGRIAEDRPDVLIYPEIGMHPLAVRLAARRLAPLQCVAWGHPVTTGLGTIDAFLSSDLMEPEDGARHYTETLVRLPNLSIHYEPLAEDPAAPRRLDFGIDERATVFVCCQSLFKYHPGDDGVLAAIARRVPHARFLFIGDPAREPNARLTRERMIGAGIPSSALVFVPAVPAASFPGLLRAGDIYLDTLRWSGGNTTLEAIACGLPIVTCPGPLMRGRHSAAILRRMGLARRIAATREAYVDMAVRLSDPDSRHDAVVEIVASRDRLYRDPEPVRALETFLHQAAGQARQAA